MDDISENNIAQHDTPWLKIQDRRFIVGLLRDAADVLELKECSSMQVVGKLVQVTQAATMLARQVRLDLARLAKKD